MLSPFTDFINLSFVLAAYIQLVNATATNYTIDDTNGDERTGEQVVYHPTSQWNVQTCKNCPTHLDVSKFMNGTYHAAASDSDAANLSITMNFSGESI